MPATREPSPVPASSLTTSTSTGPSSSLVPDTQVITARPPAWSPTAAKSVIRHPGLSGHGRYVGKVAVAPRCSTNESYDASSGRHSGGIAPCSGQDQPPSTPAWATGVAHRGHPAFSGMGPGSQEFQCRTTGCSRS